MAQTPARYPLDHPRSRLRAMKLEMTSKLDPWFPYADDGAVNIFLGPLLTPSPDAIYHGQDLSTDDFATLNTLRCALHVTACFLFPISYVADLAFPDAFPGDYNP